MLSIIALDAFGFRTSLSYVVTRFGAVAQLGERYIRIVEVEGSNPFCSTNMY